MSTPGPVPADHLIRCGVPFAPDLVERALLECAAALAGTLPPPLSKVLLVTTGAESNEAALKMAELATGHYEIVSFDRALAPTGPALSSV
jgi:4-aminobutyrate aminotransferase-like enzyme